MFNIYTPIRITLKLLSVFFIFTLAISTQKADAQQMFVDDAEVTTYRSFQIETWYGSRESWFLGAISPLPYFEFGAGFGFDSRDGFDPANWMLEAKVVPGDLEERGSAIGVVGGMLFDYNGNTEEIFAYIPYSRMILDDTSVFHVNIGWEAVNEEDWEHGLMKGIRIDLGITERLALLAEVAAVNFDDYFYQGGVRITLIPDLLEMDVTYGEGFRRMETAPGFNVGISFTPDQIW